MELSSSKLSTARTAEFVSYKHHALIRDWTWQTCQNRTCRHGLDFMLFRCAWWQLLHWLGDLELPHAGSVLIFLRCRWDAFRPGVTFLVDGGARLGHVYGHWLEVLAHVSCSGWALNAGVGGPCGEIGEVDVGGVGVRVDAGVVALRPDDLLQAFHILLGQAQVTGGEEKEEEEKFGMG